MISTLTPVFWSARANTCAARGLPAGVTHLVRSMPTCDTVEVAISPDAQWVPRPWSHTITLERGPGISFHGPVTGVKQPDDGSDIIVTAESWRGYPAGIIHGRDATHTNADPLAVIKQLWDEALSYSDAPQQLTVTAGSSSQRVGVARADGTPDPLTVAWWLGTDIGRTIADLLTHTTAVQTEDHTWIDDAPHTTITITERPTARVAPVAFAVGVNIASILTRDLTRDAVYSSVLSLGPGEGITRLAGNAAVTRDMLRRTHLDDRAPGESTRAQLQTRAARLLAAQDNVLPFDRLEVLADSDLAPAGQWDVGDIVPVIGRDNTRWQVLITAAEWSTDSTVLTVQPA